MPVEVVAVRYSCDLGCELTAVCAEGELPAGWYEWPAPPWRAHHPARFVCPDHAEEGKRLHRAQWAELEERRYVVTAADYEALRVALRQVVSQLDRLKFSGGRADDGRV